MEGAVQAFVTQCASPQARVAAHAALNQQLKLPDSEETVGCLTRNLPAILGELQRDLASGRVEVVVAALRTTSYFLHHPDFSGSLPQQVGVCVARKIVELLEHSPEREVVTLALWCIHMQRTPQLFSDFAMRSLAAAESALTNQWQSLLVCKQALDALATLVGQFPKLGQQFVDSTSQTKVAWSIFATALREATTETLQAAVQLFEQLLAVRPRVSVGKIWATAEADLASLMDDVLKLMSSKEKAVAIKTWKVIVRLIPPAEVAQPAVLNPLLKVPKQCFVSARTSMRHEGYVCWKTLIEVLGEVLAWQEVPNIFPLLLLPIERAFQPEKGSSSVCRVAAVDALTALCMRSNVSTTHLLGQGLAKLLFKCLEVDEATEESWEGCIAVLRAIACCVCAPSSVVDAGVDYWADVGNRQASDDALFHPSPDLTAEADLELCRQAVDKAGGILQLLNAHSALFVKATQVICGKLQRAATPGGAHDVAASRALHLLQHVSRQRVRFTAAYIDSAAAAPGAAERTPHPAGGSQLSQCVSGSQSEMPFSCPPPEGLDLVHLFMSELRAVVPDPGSSAFRSPVPMVLLESVVWVSCKCNAFALGIGDASSRWQQWTIAMLRTVTNHEPSLSSELPSTVAPPEVSILEAQLAALLAFHGVADETSSAAFDEDYLTVVCRECAAVVLKTGALPNLLRVFHTVIPMPDGEPAASASGSVSHSVLLHSMRSSNNVGGCSASSSALSVHLQRSMFLVQTFWRDVIAMLSSMASAELGEIDDSTRQATVVGLQEICWMPLRVYCQTTGHILHRFFPTATGIQEWLQVVAIWAKEQAAAHVVQFLPALVPAARARSVVPDSRDAAAIESKEAAAIHGIAKLGVQMLIDHSGIAEDACAALLSLFYHLHSCAPAPAPPEICAAVTKSVCKLLLQRQRGRQGSAALLAAAQEWLRRCVDDLDAFHDSGADDDASRSSFCQQVVSVLTTLASVAIAASLQTCEPVKQSLLKLLQKSLRGSNDSTSDAVSATARQFFIDVYHEKLPLSSQEGARLETGSPHQAEQEQRQQHCLGKRSPSTSPSKEVVAAAAAAAAVASTKSSHSFTQLLQSKLRTPTSERTEESRQRRSFSSASPCSSPKGGAYFEVNVSDNAPDPDTKRRKTAPVATYTTLDGSQPAGDDVFQTPDDNYDVDQDKGRASKRQRCSLLRAMDSVAHEIGRWDPQQSGEASLDEAVALWSDVLQKLWALKGSQRR